ncbi:MAG: class I SAM-dependent methyltransferase [Candidatus Marinimicrobia bacterium]|nr:class I SAM-dependent methyltransferase [Candidatus Neomarinimicrobiota bacterium]
MNLLTYKQHQDFFNQKAETWTISDNQIRFIKQLEDLVDFKGTETVLDIGCGTGNLFPYLQQKIPGGKLIGIDFAFNMLYRCREKFQERTIVLQSMAEVLPIRSTSIDVVINYCLFPHLKYKRNALREFERVLKKEGRYYILHPQGSNEINCLHRDIGEPVCFDVIEPVESVVAMLQLNGFSTRQAIDRCDMFLIEAVKSGSLS